MSLKSLGILVLVSLISSSVWAQSCEDLKFVTLSYASVEEAQLEEAGSFSSPWDDRRSIPNYDELPEFCRVSVSLIPSPDSSINMELWLPTERWNGKYLAVGNNSFNGYVRHSHMSLPLSRGYATSSTDTGHAGNTASFGLGHPEKVNDFGWRSVHEMSEASKH